LTLGPALAESLTLSIVTHGHGALLHVLLQDLAALPSLRGVPLLVTLNLPEAFDATAYPGLRIEVLRNPAPLGFGANHNAAFRLCATPWFAVLNPDLRIAEDPFPRLLERASSDETLALLAPTILDAHGRREDSVRTNLTPASLLSRCALGRRQPATARETARRGHPFYWLAGMFLLLRSSVFGAVGGFDERYFMYCEDYDLCARLYVAGHAIGVHPDAAVIHDARRDSHRSANHLRWHLRSLARVWSSRPFWRIAMSRVRCGVAGAQPPPLGHP
jgi:N-acetylglucosaminyl-diphospho-decaprenol L-rhamnosyltransferase